MRDENNIGEPTTNIIDSFADPILSVDKESRIMYVNNATERLFKNDKSDLVGKSVWNVLPKNVQITLDFYYHKALSDGKPSQYENIKLFDRRCDVNFYPTDNGLTIFIQDKSSKWQTEELYRLSLYLLERLNENVFLVRSDGRLFHVNDEACRALGYSHNELIHMKIFDIDSGINTEKWHDYFADIKKKGSISFESEFMARDGKTFPVEVNANYIMLYEVEYYCVTARDISERKQNENIRLRLVSIIESSDSAIIGKTLDGIITSWNVGAERMFGYSASEAIGKNISLLIPPGFPNEIPGILNKIKYGEHIDHYETVRKTKDGKLIDVSLTVSPSKIKTAESWVLQVLRPISQKRSV